MYKEHIARGLENAEAALEGFLNLGSVYWKEHRSRGRRIVPLYDSITRAPSTTLVILFRDGRYVKYAEIIAMKTDLSPLVNSRAHRQNSSSLAGRAWLTPWLFSTCFVDIFRYDTVKQIDKISQLDPP